MPDWNAIVADPQYAGRRVFAVIRNGERHWVKRSGKNYRNIFQRLLAPNLSALRDEALAMVALRRRGMLVPSVVHESDDFIVMSDAGESLQPLLQQADPLQRIGYVEQVADALGELHRAGGWHGNAVLRNFTLRDGRIGMLDFENTAQRMVSLNVRQAYDLWQALHTSANYPEADRLARAFLARYRPSSRALAYLRLAAWGMSPAYLLLVPFRALLKRDFRQAVDSVGCLLFD
jgi:tRNA A-37 threonylcarbamoyl transferase component Bud32